MEHMFSVYHGFQDNETKRLLCYLIICSWTNYHILYESPCLDQRFFHLLATLFYLRIFSKSDISQKGCHLSMKVQDVISQLTLIFILIFINSEDHTLPTFANSRIILITLHSHF
jgi:hypothetical protein